MYGGEAWCGGETVGIVQVFRGERAAGELLQSWVCSPNTVQLAVLATCSLESVMSTSTGLTI